MATILVVGGAGYVGSATCAWLLDHGHSVWVLDDLSSGHLELVLGNQFLRGKAGDTGVLTDLLSRIDIDCVMSFAAKSGIAESMKQPQEYYQNNVVETQTLVKAALQHGIRNFVFSSSCAIFGESNEITLSEDHPKNPLSPYGKTKLEVEKFLETEARDLGLRSISLRYFNAAGAEPELRVGELHFPETHLIPKVLRSAEEGQPVRIFGTDYPTPDGTCIRDYIHVTDLAAAHGSAMKRLFEMEKNSKGEFEAYNIGSETGFSVRQVIRKCEEVVGKRINIMDEEKRAGDPARLVANSERAKKFLNFKPSMSDLDQIIKSAYDWQKKGIAFRNRAIFLDRDGTLNEDPGYLNDANILKLLPQVGEALSLLKKAGFLLIVVSNQSGVSRGLIKIEELEKIQFRMNELLRPWEVQIDHFEACLHHPDHDCYCRKPRPKMIFDMAIKYQINLKNSYMIGDKVSDLGVGKVSGCKGSLLVRTGHGTAAEEEIKKGKIDSPDYIGDNLLAVAKWILSQKTDHLR